MNSEVNNSLVFLKRVGIFEKLTFANGGYIINMSPTAIGMLVLPDDSDSMFPGIVGKR